MLNGAYLHTGPSCPSPRSGKQFRIATAELGLQPTYPHLAKMPGQQRPIASGRVDKTSHPGISEPATSLSLKGRVSRDMRRIAPASEGHGPWTALEGQRNDAGLSLLTPHLQIKATGAALRGWSSLSFPLFPSCYLTAAVAAAALHSPDTQTSSTLNPQCLQTPLERYVPPRPAILLKSPICYTL